VAGSARGNQGVASLCELFSAWQLKLPPSPPVRGALTRSQQDVVEPVTTVVLDTAVGLVTGYAKVKHGTVESVSILEVNETHLSYPQMTQ